MSPAARRFFVAMLLALVLSWVISETIYRLALSSQRQTPQRVELVIPAGTGDRVAQGQPSPALPAEMSFLQGDVLVVVNQDTVSHQLGPIWAPPGGSASMTLDQANQYSFACTFQPSKYLGLTVRKALTNDTRLVGVLVMGIPSGMMVWLYSLVALPLKPKTAGVG
jgi:hypothetical protein